MSKKYDEMTVDELKKVLLELGDELEDAEDERMMMLGQSGHHISSGRLATRYNEMLGDINDKIQKVNELMKAKS